jgi:hypothetical protein
MARLVRPAATVVRSKTRIAIGKTPNESDGLDPSHFLPCIEMAELGGERAASKSLV